MNFKISLINDYSDSLSENAYLTLAIKNIIVKALWPNSAPLATREQVINLNQTILLWHIAPCILIHNPVYCIAER